MHFSKIWHQLLQSTWPMNYFPSCPNLLSLHPESREYTVGRLSAHMLVFALSQLPCCPLYTVDCPSFMFPWTWPSSSYSSCLYLFLFCHLQGTLPALHPPPAGMMLLPCGLAAAPQRHCSHVSPFMSVPLPFLWEMELLRMKGVWGTGMNSPWRRMRWEDWKIVFELKTKQRKLKPKQQPLTTLKTLAYGYPVIFMVCQYNQLYKPEIEPHLWPPIFFFFCPFMNPFIISKPLTKKISYMKWGIGS